jgi:hypothetical protein
LQIGATGEQPRCVGMAQVVGTNADLEAGLSDGG